MEIEEDEEAKQLRLEKETTQSVITGMLPCLLCSVRIISFFLITTIDLKRNFSLLERAVNTIESRFTTRVLRTLPSIRRRLTSSILAQVISDYYSTGAHL